MPKAARERVTSPRAGAALAPVPRSVSQARPLRARFESKVTQRATQVNNCTILKDYNYT
jgi:hypothetical protein